MYLAMEYVEGKSLRAIMQAAGALPVDEALGHRAADRRRARLPARAQGRAPRPQARERPAHRRRAGEDPRLRHRARRGGAPADLGRACRRRSARPTTWRPSRSAGGAATSAPTSTRWARCSSRCSPAICRTQAPNPHALMRAKTNDDPRPPSYFLPAVDPALEAIVVRAIERSPRDRYETVGAVAERPARSRSAVRADGSRTTTPARRRFRAAAPRGGSARGVDDLRRPDRAGRAQPSRPRRRWRRLRRRTGRSAMPPAAPAPSLEHVAQPGLGAARRAFS